MYTTQKTKRLEILETSLVKKNDKFDAQVACHFASVKAANGQPLNDKRGGAAVINRWEKQNDSLRTLNESIKKTEDAIDREKSKIANVSSFEIPEYLRPLIESGKIQQWRKHPRFFFVAGVEKARIAVQEDGTIGHRYVKKIPTKEQYAIFRDIFNFANRKQKEITKIEV